MKKLITSILAASCLLSTSVVIAKCGDPNCSYEKKDKHSNGTTHYDNYGNALGKTVP